MPAFPTCFSPGCIAATSSIRFEFLDNSVALGERPRTAVFGDNDSVHILDVKKMLDIDRYGRVFVDAASPDELYRDPRIARGGAQRRVLEALCRGISVRQFRLATDRENLFADRIRNSGWVDPDALQTALADPDTRAGLGAVAPAASEGRVRAAERIRGT